jgi:hypothetical protein
VGSLDDKLRDILEDWYPGTQYENVIPRLKKVFESENYIQIPEVVKDKTGFVKIHPEGMYMTGEYWYNKFKAEYHNKADWIAGDPEMGDDAEQDVLLAARLASGIK